VTVPLTQIPAGHTFEPMTFTVDADRARAYLRATGDTLSLYEDQGAVPPLAVAALALGSLLEAVGLPDGTLHANETMRVHAPVPAGSTLQCNARLAQRSQRGGWVVTALESEITLDGQTVLATRATVMCPAEAS
jgi:acyl dehydratase